MLSDEELLKRAYERSHAQISPKILETLWPTFPSDFISFYEQKETGLKVPKGRSCSQNALKDKAKETNGVFYDKDASPSAKSDYPVSLSVKRNGEYGGQVDQGEAAAILPYIQSGKRVPRRGEIGLTAEEIAGYERAGYVMSGNRNVYMTTMRMKKEAAVIGLEEERRMRALAMEAKRRREAQLVESLRAMIPQKPQGPPSNEINHENAAEP